MTETELRRKLAENQQKYASATTEASKALLYADSEKMAKELDALTGGVSAFDANTGKWSLSASNQRAIDKYFDMQNIVDGSVYEGYDPTDDPTYATLRKQYLREEDRGVRDTLAAYSGNTGGYASTAAVAAAQETGNYHRSKLADWQVQLAEDDYNKYMQQLALDRDLLDDYKDDAFESAEALAALGDFTELGRLYGWTPEQIALARADWLKSQSRGRGGGGGSGKKSADGDYKTEDTTKLYYAQGYGWIPWADILSLKSRGYITESSSKDANGNYTYIQTTKKNYSNEPIKMTR